jgi:hypothetical protein
MFFKKGTKGDATPAPSDIEMAQGVSNDGSEADSSETNSNPNRNTIVGMQFEDGFRYQTVRYRCPMIGIFSN